MKFIMLAAGAAASLMLMASTASAATPSIVGLAPTVFTTGDVDPTKSLDLGGGTWTATRTSVSGSVGGQWRSPWDTAPVADRGTQYWTVGTNAAPSPNAPNPAILEFDRDISTLTFLWGSIDTYNTLYFYDINGSEILSERILGSQILALIPNPQQAVGAALVRISNLAAGVRAIGFGSSQNAFEFSNIVVPIPPAILMLLSGLLGLGFLGRRRSKTA